MISGGELLAEVNLPGEHYAIFNSVRPPVKMRPDHTCHVAQHTAATQADLKIELWSEADRSKKSPAMPSRKCYGGMTDILRGVASSLVGLNEFARGLFASIEVLVIAPIPSHPGNNRESGC